MRGRFAPLSPITLLLALLALMAASGQARAHRLEADYRVLPEQRVEVEAWFDLTRDSPKGAAVQVLRADGTALTEGRLDADGMFAFSFDTVESLKVVVNAGAGHRKELNIPADELAKVADTGKTPAAPAPEPAAPHRFAERTPAVGIKDVITGVGFLLALGAFVLSVRNARQLRRLAGARRGLSPPSAPPG
jgi:nickel transport protein